MTFTQAWEIEN